MIRSLLLYINGAAIEVPEGSSVAAALAHALGHVRRSPSGTQRAPLCGMGVCFECVVRIDGQPDRRACLSTVAAGMQIETEA
jgi:D-hydroxyproline dehydrogenase subunit gamma